MARPTGRIGEDMERLTEIKTHVTGFSYTDKKEGIFAQNVYAKLARSATP
jgi:hypothetical protein